MTALKATDASLADAYLPDHATRTVIAKEIGALEKQLSNFNANTTQGSILVQIGKWEKSKADYIEKCKLDIEKHNKAIEEAMAAKHRIEQHRDAKIAEIDAQIAELQRSKDLVPAEVEESPMDQEVDADGAAFKIQLHRELPGYTLDQLKALVAQASAFQQAGARVIPPATTPTKVTDLT